MGTRLVAGGLAIMLNMAKLISVFALVSLKGKKSGMRLRFTFNTFSVFLQSFDTLQATEGEFTSFALKLKVTSVLIKVRRCVKSTIFLQFSSLSDT